MFYWTYRATWLALNPLLADRTLDADDLFAFLDRIGYAGWIGCEYKPAAATEAGLGWAATYLKH